MRFIAGAPHLGVEVRSENDYGPAADMADKRADYFQAGAEVVWDVDTLPHTLAARASRGSFALLHLAIDTHMLAARAGRESFALRGQSDLPRIVEFYTPTPSQPRRQMTCAALPSFAHTPPI